MAQSTDEATHAVVDINNTAKRLENMNRELADIIRQFKI